MNRAQNKQSLLPPIMSHTLDVIREDGEAAAILGHGLGHVLILHVFQMDQHSVAKAALHCSKHLIQQLLHSRPAACLAARRCSVEKAEALSGWAQCFFKR